MFLSDPSRRAMDQPMPLGKKHGVFTVRVNLRADHKIGRLPFGARPDFTDRSLRAVRPTLPLHG